MRFLLRKNFFKLEGMEQVHFLTSQKESAVIIIDPQNMDKSCELNHSSFFKTHLF